MARFSDVPIWVVAVVVVSMLTVILGYVVFEYGIAALPQFVLFSFGVLVVLPLILLFFGS